MKANAKIMAFPSQYVYADRFFWFCRYFLQRIFKANVSYSRGGAAGNKLKMTLGLPVYVQRHPIFVCTRFLYGKGDWDV